MISIAGKQELISAVTSVQSSGSQAELGLLVKSDFRFSLGRVEIEVYIVFSAIPSTPEITLACCFRSQFTTPETYSNLLVQESIRFHGLYRALICRRGISHRYCIQLQDENLMSTLSQAISHALVS